MTKTKTIMLKLELIIHCSMSLITLRKVSKLAALCSLKFLNQEGLSKQAETILSRQLRSIYKINAGAKTPFTRSKDSMYWMLLIL